VDYDKRNKQEYMTISARGITYYVDNVGEFIKIEQWEKEVKQFDRLGQIQFFKEYKLWKNFYIWKKLTRKNIMKKCQNVLVNSLFILDRCVFISDTCRSRCWRSRTSRSRSASWSSWT